MDRRGSVTPWGRAPLKLNIAPTCQFIYLFIYMDIFAIITMLFVSASQPDTLIVIWIAFESLRKIPVFSFYN